VSDELDVVAQYFGDGDSSADDYDDAGLYDDEPAVSARTAELDLVDEYRESNFDAAEVGEWRGVVSDIEAGEYTADDYLSAYNAEDDGDWDGYSEIEGLAEPEPQLTAEEALEALESLPPAQMAEGIKYLEANHPGMAEPLLQAYVDRHERNKLEGAWQHLTNVSEAHAAMQDRQVQQQEAQLAEAAETARGMVSEEFRRAGAGRVDADTGLAAAVQVAAMQLKAWEQAGYSQEQIDGMADAEFDKWCIRTAAELGRQATVTHYALGKV
jgi:hypothetical protein